MKKFIYVFNCPQYGQERYITANSMKEAVDQYQNFLNQHPYFTYSKEEAKKWFTKRIKNYDWEDNYTLVYLSKNGNSVIYDGQDENEAKNLFNQLKKEPVNKMLFVTNPEIENQVVRLLLYKTNYPGTKILLLISEPFIRA